jgi:biopolymer transport protein ExbD
MSHGSAADKCEPNLVPMLDMVLQLVMFFMVCANFVMEQVNESIKLPVAVVAKPIEKEEYFIFLNINKDGHVLLSALDAIGDDRILTNPKRVETYMKQRAKEDLRAAGNDKNTVPRSVIILRVDREAPFVRATGSDKPGVYEIMKACRAAGYEKVLLRAIRFGGQLENP